MFKNALSTERDVKEAAMIERRREAEKERQKRFFDAKQRILGIDCNALNKQISEKQRQKELEAEQERIAQEEMKRNLEIAEAKEQELLEQKRQKEKEINQYRKEYQKPNDTHEFDLSDPEAKKKMLPARQDDSDPRLSVSGAQLFIGEDLTREQRIRQQQLQQKNWLDQQILEKKRLQDNKKKSEDSMSKTMYKQDMQAINMSDRKDQDKREMMRQIREYNQNLAQQKKENDLQQKRQDQDDNLAEMYNLLSSDLLKEKTESTSNLGPNRIIPYAYKGMTKEDIEKLNKEKQDQLADLCRRRQEQEHLKHEWDELAANMNRQMTLKERELSKTIRNMNHEVREENERLALEQKQNQEYINKVVNTNQPTPEYFDKFNTTAR